MTHQQLKNDIALILFDFLRREQSMERGRTLDADNEAGAILAHVLEAIEESLPVHKDTYASTEYGKGRDDAYKVAFNETGAAIRAVLKGEKK